MTSASERATVAVIGAGFSGLLTAVRLLADPHGPRVRLIERRTAFARGAAYSTEDPAHLLNIRASNMSAFPEQPTHFCDWLAEHAGQLEHAGDNFVSRRTYGDYLQAMLRGAAERSGGGRLTLEADEALALEKTAAGWRIALGMGRSVSADIAVLATGNLRPAAPASFSPEVIASPAYVTDPWSIDPVALPQAGTALLIGSGLTMIDVALHLSRLRPGLRMTTLSRRGLLPRRHLAVGPAPALWDEPAAATVRSLLSQIRRRSEHQDWRAVIDGLRPQVRSIWRAWTPAERNRFLRHARPWWDVHRHRLAPTVAVSLDHLMGSARLSVLAGSVGRVERDGDGFEVTWTPRGTRVSERFPAVVVVNCTGPNNDLAKSGDPLLQQLLRDGVARQDPRGLGLEVDDDSRMIDGAGRVSGALFAVGPITRGAFWEITSVPDIRVQAADCARTILRRLALDANPA